MCYTFCSSCIISADRLSNMHIFQFVTYSMMMALLWRAETCSEIQFDFIHEDFCDLTVAVPLILS